MFHTTHALKCHGFRNHLIALCHPSTQPHRGALMKVQERSNDIQFVNWIVLINLMVDPVALLYQEIMTSILLFYFDKVIRMTSEDFENSPQITWTTAIINLRVFFVRFWSLNAQFIVITWKKATSTLFKIFPFLFIFCLEWHEGQ